MTMLRNLLSLGCIILSLPLFSQNNPELTALGNEIYNALADQDEDAFVNAYPTYEESVTFFKNTNKDVSDEKAKEVVAELNKKGHDNFKSLSAEIKKKGTSWKSLKLLEVTHLPLADDAERIDVYIYLALKQDTLTLQLSDVVKMADKLWKLTDVGKIVAGKILPQPEELVTEETTVGGNQLVSVIKYFQANIKDYLPTAGDEKVIEASSFVPPNDTVESALFLPYFGSPVEHLNVSFKQNGTMLDDEELMFNVVNFKMEYWDFPGWPSASPLLDIASVRDKKGNELLLKRSKLREYKEKGLIEDPTNFINSADYEASIWLNRALEPKEEVAVLGQMIWTYAKAYATVTFTKADIGSTKEFEGAALTLKSLDKNIATFEILDSHKIDEAKKLFVNVKSQQFTSLSTLGTAKVIYDELENHDFTLSDEQIDTLATNYEEDPSAPMVKLYKVSGNIDRIVFYKATEYGEKLIPFRMIFTNQ